MLDERRTSSVVIRMRAVLGAALLVVLEAYVTAAVYLIQRILARDTPIISANLFDAALRDSAFMNFRNIQYYIWPDMAENVLNAFYIAHGMKFGRDAVVNHLPGVYVYLAGFMALFGYGSAVPSPQTALAGYALSAFAVALFQIACVVAAFHAFSRLRLGLVLAPALVAYTGLQFDTMLPLSENLIAYWLIFAFALLCRMMVFDADPKTKALTALMFGGPVNFICVTLGATVFPVNVLLGLVCLAYCGLLLVRHGDTIVRPFVVAAAKAALLSTTLFAVILATTDLRGMFFWNIEANKGYLFNPEATMLGAPLRHFENFASGALPIGANLFHLLPAMLIFLFAYVCFRKDRRGLGAVFTLLAVIAVAAILTQWRTNIGYKSGMSFGMSWALIIASCAIVLDAMPRRTNLPAQSNWPMVSLAAGWTGAACLFLGLVPLMFNYSTAHAARPAAFEEANVCRFGTRQNCRCAQGVVFAPQDFLITDVMPCENRYPGWAAFLGNVNTTREWLLADTRSKSVAFFVVNKERMQDRRFPEEIFDYWKEHGRCVDLSPGISKICFNP